MECKNCPYYDSGLDGQYCDKVGGKTLLFGYCEDACLKTPRQINHSKQNRRNKRERDHKHKNHLKFLAENISGYPSPAIYMNAIWIKGQGYVENSNHIIKDYIVGEDDIVILIIIKRCLTEKFVDIKESYQRMEI